MKVLSLNPMDDQAVTVGPLTKTLNPQLLSCMNETNVITSGQGCLPNAVLFSSSSISAGGSFTCQHCTLYTFFLITIINKAFYTSQCKVN